MTNEHHGAQYGKSSKSSHKSRSSDRYSASLLKNHAPNLRNEDILEGQLIWAQMEGHPPWPGKIHQLSPKSKDMFFVFFFGPDETEKWGWIRMDQAKLFNQESAKWFLTKVEPHVKNSTEAQSLKSAIVEALEFYDQIIEFINSGGNLDSLPNGNDSTGMSQANVNALSPRLKNDDAAVSVDNEDLCFRCKLGGFLILCDGCTNACHPECDDPPMENGYVPEGLWFCLECREKQSKGDYIPLLTEAHLLLSMQDYESSSDESSESENEPPPQEDQEWRKKPVMHNTVTTSNDSRCVDPLKRILNRGYWGSLPIKTGSYNEFQTLQSKLVLQGSTSRRSTRQRRKDDNFEAPKPIQQEKKSAQPAVTITKETKTTTTTKSQKTSTSRKRKRTSSTRRRIVRSKVSHYDSDSDHSHPENYSTESEDEKTPKFIPKPKNLSRCKKTTSSIVPPTVVNEPHKYTFSVNKRRIEKQKHLDTYLDDNGATELIDSRKTISLYIRYRFTNESDDCFRLVKTRISVPYARGGVRTQDVISIVADDAALVPRDFEFRYYDSEDDGWLLMRKENVIPVDLSSGDVCFRVLLYNLTLDKSD